MRSLVGRGRRPDALRLQPRPRRARLALAAPRLAPLPHPGQRDSSAIVVFSYLLTNAAYIAGGDTAIAIVTAISTIALYWAYGVPIFLGVFGKQEWRDHAVWKLGRFSKPIACWRASGSSLISFLFLWPTSGNPYTLMAYVVFLGAWSSTTSPGPASRFKGPIVEVGEAELTEIEQEFEERPRSSRGHRPALDGGAGGTGTARPFALFIARRPGPGTPLTAETVGPGPLGPSRSTRRRARRP